MLSPISKRLETIEKELDEKRNEPEDEKKKDQVKVSDGETSDKEKDKKVDDEKMSRSQKLYQVMLMLRSLLKIKGEKNYENYE